MDQNKNQGQQPDRSRNQGQPPTHDKDRQDIHKDHQDMPAPGTGNREKGRGKEGERNLGGGISNRDMGRELDEQDEVPERGERQSER
jgi:hypothetical protein